MRQKGRGDLYLLSYFLIHGPGHGLLVLSGESREAMTDLAQKVLTGSIQRDGARMGFSHRQETYSSLFRLSRGTTAVIRGQHAFYYHIQTNYPDLLWITPYLNKHGYFDHIYQVYHIYQVNEL